MTWNANMTEFITQIMPGLLLVGLGMLIGYVLWFRDRQRDEMIQNRLQESNRKLKGELESLQQRSQEDEGELKIRSNKIQMLQELCDDLATTRDQANEQRIQLESKLNGKTELLNSVQEELSQYKDKFDAASEKVQSTESEWLSKLGQAESRMSSKESDLRHLNSENRRLVSELQNRDARIDELSAELATQRSMLATASQNANKLEKECVSLQSSVNRQSELLKESRLKVAAAEAGRDKSEKQSETIRRQLDELQDVKNKLHEMIVEREKAERDVVIMNEKFKITREQWREAYEKSKQLELECERFRESTAALTTRLGNQESTIRHQQDRLTELSSQLTESHECRERDNELQGRQAVDLEQQIHKYRVHVESTQMINEELKCQVAHADKEKTKLLEAFRKTEQEKVRLSSSCDLLKQQVQTVTEERQKLIDRLETQSVGHSQQLTNFQNRIAELQKQAGQTHEQLRELKRDRLELRAQLQDFENSQDESEQLFELQHAELMTRLKMTIGQRDQAFAELKTTQDQLNQLSEQVNIRTRDAQESREELESLRELLLNLGTQSGEPSNLPANENPNWKSLSISELRQEIKKGIERSARIRQLNSESKVSQSKVA